MLTDFKETTEEKKGFPAEINLWNDSKHFETAIEHDYEHKRVINVTDFSVTHVCVMMQITPLFFKSTISA